jgi:hypothetical protein
MSDGLKLHSRTMLVQRASADIRTALLDLQEQHDLTDVEMLGVVGEWQAGKLKWMLRAERHPDEPGKRADEA